MKNILVTGANGQLGNEMRVLSAEYKEYTCFFTDVAELDICDEQAVMTFVKENNIHVIVNCAAYTAVDKAEDDIELCTKLNKNAVSSGSFGWGRGSAPQAPNRACSRSLSSCPFCQTRVWCHCAARRHSSCRLPTPSWPAPLFGG